MGYSPVGYKVIDKKCMKFDEKQDIHIFSMYFPT